MTGVDMEMLPEVEDRIVAALRQQGLLHGTKSRQSTSRWLATAAGVFLFAGGVALGEYHAIVRAEAASATQREQDVQQTAAFVQRAGSEYVAAVARLASIAATGTNLEQAAQGREAAVSAMHAAAAELQKVNPSDPTAQRLLDVLAAANPDDQPGIPGSTRRVIWY